MSFPAPIYQALQSGFNLVAEVLKEVEKPFRFTFEKESTEHYSGTMKEVWESLMTLQRTQHYLPNVIAINTAMPTALGESRMLTLNRSYRMVQESLFRDQEKKITLFVLEELGIIACSELFSDNGKVVHRFRQFRTIRVEELFRHYDSQASLGTLEAMRRIIEDIRSNPLLIQCSVVQTTLPIGKLLKVDAWALLLEKLEQPRLLNAVKAFSQEKKGIAWVRTFSMGENPQYQIVEKILLDQETGAVLMLFNGKILRYFQYDSDRSCFDVIMISLASHADNLAQTLEEVKL